MSVTIRPSQVLAALSPRLTEGLAAQLCGPVCDVLCSYVPHRTDLLALRDQVEDVIFRQLFHLLGARMAFRRPDGRIDRIRTEELPDLTDAAMGVLLHALLPTPANFALLRAYAMSAGSLTAMALLVSDSYASCQTEAEVALLRRILAERTVSLPQA